MLLAVCSLLVVFDIAITVGLYKLQERMENQRKLERVLNELYRRRLRKYWHDRQKLDGMLKEAWRRQCEPVRREIDWLTERVETALNHIDDDARLITQWTYPDNHPFAVHSSDLFEAGLLFFDLAGRLKAVRSMIDPDQQGAPLNLPGAWECVTAIGRQLAQADFYWTKWKALSTAAAA